MNPVTASIAAEVGDIVRREIDAPAGVVNAAASPSVAQVQIERATAKAVAPIIAHATNQEPWYQSRVALSAIIGVAAAVAGGFGYTMAPEHRDVILALLLAIGGLVQPALNVWARYFAAKPLGA